MSAGSVRNTEEIKDERRKNTYRGAAAAVKA